MHGAQLCIAREVEMPICLAPSGNLRQVTLHNAGVRRRRPWKRYRRSGPIARRIASRRSYTARLATIRASGPAPRARYASSTAKQRKIMRSAGATLIAVSEGNPAVQSTNYS
jgi:hypothetical protein